MKTAEEWKAELIETPRIPTSRNIRRIQADALRWVVDELRRPDLTPKSTRLRWVARLEVEAKKLEEK